MQKDTLASRIKTAISILFGKQKVKAVPQLPDGTQTPRQPISVDDPQGSIQRLMEEYRYNQKDLSLWSDYVIEFHKIRLEQMYAIYEHLLDEFRSHPSLTNPSLAENKITPEDVHFDLADPTATLRDLKRYFKGMSMQAIETEIEARIAPHEREFEVLEYILVTAHEKLQAQSAIENGEIPEHTYAHFTFSQDPKQHPMQMYYKQGVIVINTHHQNASVDVLVKDFLGNSQHLANMIDRTLSHPNLQHHFPNDIDTFRHIFNRALVELVHAEKNKSGNSTLH